MPNPSRRDKAKIIGRYVSRQVWELQHQYVTKQGSTPQGRAKLACLRRDLDGAMPSWMLVGEELFSRWPEELGSPRDSSPELNAVRASLGLYALHQQSKKDAVAQGASTDWDKRMTFGRACRLIADPGHDNGVRRRLRSAETAADFAGVVRNVRSLIMLMRNAEGRTIQLDYRSLAADLYLVQFRDLRDGVFQSWGRDYYTKPQ